VISLNINHLKNKLFDVAHLVESQKPDHICLQ